ncbi:MAG: DNA alkylation repair protein [Bacteroidia bacterium]|nr:DNA alkylation repair protein [Bacteroidia bacterium]
MNKFHSEILECIKQNSGTPTQHTYLDSYLGNSNARYPINMPTLRIIAKEWIALNNRVSAIEFQKFIDSLIRGKSSTEKTMAGILLGYSTKEQRKFDPSCFDTWLEHLVGWAEIDSVCTGPYSTTEIYGNWKIWNPLLVKFSKSKNSSKRRASLVLLCSPMRKAANKEIAHLAFSNINRLKAEREILITKAISWLLRSMIKHHKKEVAAYVNENEASLPAIAFRETMIVLKTGKKTK